MIKKFKEYFGFVKQDLPTVEERPEFTWVDNIDEKVSYLKELSEEENERQNIIEGKTAQLIGQTGVIFSLVGLFIPMYFDKIGHVGLLFRIILITVFLLTLFFYLVTLFHSMKYLNIEKFNYVRRTADTVNEIYSKKKKFLIEEARDLMHSIKNNTAVNNCKASYLVYSYRSFKVANFLVGILSLMLLSSIFFIPKETSPEVTIGKAVEIKDLKESLVQIRIQLQSIKSSSELNQRLLQISHILSDTSNVKVKIEK